MILTLSLILIPQENSKESFLPYLVLSMGALMLYFNYTDDLALNLKASLVNFWLIERPA
jgi:hypothetical protein